MNYHRSCTHCLYCRTNKKNNIPPFRWAPLGLRCHTPQAASGGLTFPNFRSFQKLCWWHTLQIFVMYMSCIFAPFRSSWFLLVPVSWRFRLWGFNFTLPLLKSIQDKSPCLNLPGTSAISGGLGCSTSSAKHIRPTQGERLRTQLSWTRHNSVVNDWNVSQLSSAQRTIQSILHPFSFERRLVSIDLEQRHLFWQQKMQKLASNFLVDRLQDSKKQAYIPRPCFLPFCRSNNRIHRSKCQILSFQWASTKPAFRGARGYQLLEQTKNSYLALQWNCQTVLSSARSCHQKGAS